MHAPGEEPRSSLAVGASAVGAAVTWSGRERPLLFKAPMVRALLAGTKTQTRRFVKYPRSVSARGIHPRMDEWMGNRYTKGSGQYPGGNPEFTGDQPPALLVTCLDDTCQRVPCPYGIPGDRIWVKETWAVDSSLDLVKPSDLDAAGVDVEYLADGARRKPHRSFERGKTRVSIFMVKQASRITLGLSDVRVERASAISEEDARAEGIVEVGDGRWGVAGGEGYRNARNAYRALWAEINGAETWDAWTWALTFAVLP